MYPTLESDKADTGWVGESPGLSPVFLNFRTSLVLRESPSGLRPGKRGRFEERRKIWGEEGPYLPSNPISL